MIPICSMEQDAIELNKSAFPRFISMTIFHRTNGNNPDSYITRESSVKLALPLASCAYISIIFS